MGHSEHDTLLNSGNTLQPYMTWDSEVRVSSVRVFNDYTNPGSVAEFESFYVVPEPSTLLLALLGGLSILAVRRRR